MDEDSLASSSEIIQKAGSNVKVGWVGDHIRVAVRRVQIEDAVGNVIEAERVDVRDRVDVRRHRVGGMRSEDEVFADDCPSRDPHHLTVPLHDPDDVAAVDDAVAVQRPDAVGCLVGRGRLPNRRFLAPGVLHP